MDTSRTYEGNDASRLKELYVEFQLILNPEDKNDKSILDTLWAMQNKDEKNNLLILIEFSEKLALLLKHDWERAKLEAKPLWYSWSKPTRKSYDEFKNKRNATDS